MHADLAPRCSAVECTCLDFKSAAVCLRCRSAGTWYSHVAVTGMVRAKSNGFASSLHERELVDAWASDRPTPQDSVHTRYRCGHATVV